MEQSVSLKPEHSSIIISLIQQDLKTHKLFSILLQAGFDNSFYRAELSDSILSLLDLQDETDQTFDFYYMLIEQHCQLITPDSHSVVQHAQQVYHKLITEKERRERASVTQSC